MNKNHDVPDLKTAVTCKSYLKSCEKRRLNFNDEQNRHFDQIDIREQF